MLFRFTAHLLPAKVLAFVKMLPMLDRFILHTVLNVVNVACSSRRVTVFFNGLEELLGRDNKLRLFKDVISTEYNVTYTETSGCLGAVK